jgi:ribulose-phosphate 3-epimerase
MTLLAPSILSADFSNLAQQIRLAEMADPDWIHCDVMDGHFVPNITFGPLIIKAAKKITRLPLDVHLMISNPDEYLERFAEAGADHIIVHQEAAVHLNRTISRIKELGLKAGVALNPSTPVESLAYVAEYIDQVLVMSVNPGFGNQEFIPNSLRKIEDAVRLRSRYNSKFLIEVDGGINKETIASVLKAGCDVFIAGSSIFKADNITAAAAELKNILKQSKGIIV